MIFVCGAFSVEMPQAKRTLIFSGLSPACRSSQNLKLISTACNYIKYGKSCFLRSIGSTAYATQIARKQV